MPGEMSILEILENQRQSDIVKEFIAKHPEYYTCPENAEVLVTHGQKIDEPFTLELLEKVYQKWKYYLIPHPPVVSSSIPSGLGSSYMALDVSGTQMMVPISYPTETTYTTGIDTQTVKVESGSGTYQSDWFKPPSPNANFVLKNSKTGPVKIEPPAPKEYDSQILETATGRRIKNDE